MRTGPRAMMHSCTENATTLETLLVHFETMPSQTDASHIVAYIDDQLNISGLGGGGGAVVGGETWVQAETAKLLRMLRWLRTRSKKSGSKGKNAEVTRLKIMVEEQGLLKFTEKADDADEKDDDDSSCEMSMGDLSFPEYPKGGRATSSGGPSSCSAGVRAALWGVFAISQEWLRLHQHVRSHVSFARVVLVAFFTVPL